MVRALNSWMTSLWIEAKEALLHTGRWWLRWWLPALSMVMVTCVALWILSPLDDAIRDRVKSANASSSGWKEVAAVASYYGDFLGFNLVLFAVGHGVARLRRSRRLHRLATAGLICACLSGLSANVIRFMTGRPRPAAMLKDRFYGPHLRSQMQSFPSAHTATAMGATLPVILHSPLLGTPLVACAAVVAWSRIQLDRHHLTDVLGSTLLALLFAIPLARWAADVTIATPAVRSARLPAHALPSA